MTLHGDRGESDLKVIQRGRVYSREQLKSELNDHPTNYDWIDEC